MGRYLVRRKGKLCEISLRPGEMIFIQPHCAMEPHPEAKYRSLGIVFASQLTRFLIAEKNGSGQRKSLSSIYFQSSLSATLDSTEKIFWKRSVGRPPGNRTTFIYETWWRHFW